MFIDSYYGHCLVATDSKDIVLTNCFYQANAPFVDPQGVRHPSSGVVLREGSSAWIWNTAARGSHGFPLSVPAVDLLPGGDAVFVSDSTLHGFSSGWSGGTGNSVNLGGCQVAAPGGAALRVEVSGGPAPLVVLQQGVLAAGSAGFTQTSCATPPPVTQAIEAPAGTVQSQFGKARLLQVPGNPTEAGMVRVELLGGSNDVFALFVAAGVVSPTPLPNFINPMWIDPSTAQLMRLGSLNAFGAATFDVDVSNLSPLLVEVQAALFATDNSQWLTNPKALFIH